MGIMVSSPLVSIVTPSYNQAEYLEETILSVLNQEYSPIEYLIIDGGSDDGSREIIKRYEDQISWWVSEKDRGQTDAINKGFSLARGQILAWINSDDTYFPRAVAEAVQFFEQNPEFGMVYGDLNYIDEEGRILGKFDARQTNYERLRKGGVNIPQPASFWRAELWKQVGPLDPSYYFAMDYDLWIRFSQITKIKYLSGHTWANFRLHDKSKTIAADRRCWEEMLRIHYRDGGQTFSFLVFKYWIRRILAPLWNWYKRRRLSN